jgi:hypothetical protein
MRLRSCGWVSGAAPMRPALVLPSPSPAILISPRRLVIRASCRRTSPRSSAPVPRLAPSLSPTMAGESASNAIAFSQLCGSLEYFQSPDSALRLPASSLPVEYADPRLFVLCCLAG